MYSIVANPGNFAEIFAAASADAAVDWWDETDRNSVVCTECFAAVELYSYLKKIWEMSGNDFKDIRLVADTGNYGITDLNLGIVFLLGNADTNSYINRLQEKTGISICANSSVKKEGYRIKCFTFSGSKYVILSGNDRVGTLYAVYAYLEKLGVRWYGIGEKGTHYPTVSSIEIDKTDEVENTAYYTRGCYSEYIDDSNGELIDWMAHNRMNYAQFAKINHPNKLKKLGIQTAGGGHEILYRFLVPDQEYPYRYGMYGSNKPDDPYPISEEYNGDINGDEILSYSKAHPEWYCLIDGKRRFRRDLDELKIGGFTGDNFCTSDKYAVEELCKEIVQDLISGKWSKVDYLSFWLLDNGKWCTCENCKQAGNYSYKMIMLVYRLRKEIEKAMDDGRLKRNIKIMFPAYHETLEGPDRPLPLDFDYENCYAVFFPIERCYVHFLDDPGCTETNRKMLNDYNTWTGDEYRHYRGEIFLGEYYNVSAFASMPVLLSQIIAHDIPFYYKTGARHFYYMHLTAGGWGMNTLKNYQYSKMLWNPNLDVDRLYNDYFKNYYQEISEDMRLCYGKLESSIANIKYLKHYQWKEGIRHSILNEVTEETAFFFHLKHLQYDKRLEDSNAGISLKETMELLRECRDILEEAMLKSKKKIVEQRMYEDIMGFSYAENILHFIYHIIRTSILKSSGRSDLARLEFKRLKLYGSELIKTIFPFKDIPYCSEFKNGLDATRMLKTYEQFTKEFDKSESHNLFED